ncbi:MAG: hypothetical protein J0L88_11155 [Xanthomonadales bacterium]|nr:hypothetical protein [Xanthomonadales bacterium]
MSATIERGQQAGMRNVTDLLEATRHGDKAAEGELFNLVYDDLRIVARRLLRVSPARLQTTSLVNETYLRLAGPEGLPYRDRGHLFAVAARAMLVPLAGSVLPPTLPPNWLPSTWCAPPPTRSIAALPKPPMAMPVMPSCVALAAPTGTEKPRAMALAVAGRTITQRVALSARSSLLYADPGCVIASISRLSVISGSALARLIVRGQAPGMSKTMRF